MWTVVALGFRARQNFVWWKSLGPSSTECFTKMSQTLVLLHVVSTFSSHSNPALLVQSWLGPGPKQCRPDSPHSLSVGSVFFCVGFILTNCYTRLVLSCENTRHFEIPAFLPRNPAHFGLPCPVASVSIRKLFRFLYPITCQMPEPHCKLTSPYTWFSTHVQHMPHNRSDTGIFIPKHFCNIQVLLILFFSS